MTDVEPFDAVYDASEATFGSELLDVGNVIHQLLSFFKGLEVHLATCLLLVQQEAVAAFESWLFDGPSFSL